MSISPSPLAPPSSAAPSPALEPQSGPSADPWVQALFAFSRTVDARRQSGRRKVVVAHPPAAPVASPTLPYGYTLAEMAPQLANPQDPLRERDRAALGEFFGHDQMATIEADILNRLSHLVPEPAWDVDPYEFLREFL